MERVFTGVSDQLALLVQQIAAIKTGVTDGSDAAPGEIGEFMSANGTGPIPTATPIDVVSLVLPAGDWDVSGSAGFLPSVANITLAQAWLSETANTPADPGRLAISVGVGALGNTFLVVGPLRLSFAAPATQVISLGCEVFFPAGTTVTANAWIRARRAR